MNSFHELSQRISKLERMVTRMIQVGTIQEVFPEDATAVCLLLDEDQITTSPLPWLTQHAGNNIEWWVPDAGEQVLILTVPGQTETSVILPAIYSTQFPAPETNPAIHKIIISDGTEVIHDTENKTLSVTTPCEVTITAEKTTVNTKDTLINVDGKADVKVTGNAVVEANETTLITHSDLNANIGGNATVKASGEVKVDGSKIVMNKGTAGGVVCQQSMCALTGGPHPQGSTTILGAS